MPIHSLVPGLQKSLQLRPGAYADGVVDDVPEVSIHHTGRIVTVTSSTSGQRGDSNQKVISKKILDDAQLTPLERAERGSLE